MMNLKKIKKVALIQDGLGAEREISLMSAASPKLLYNIIDRIFPSLAEG